MSTLGKCSIVIYFYFKQFYILKEFNDKDMCYFIS